MAAAIMVVIGVHRCTGRHITALLIIRLRIVRLPIPPQATGLRLLPARLQASNLPHCLPTVNGLLIAILPSATPLPPAMSALIYTTIIKEASQATT